MKMLNKLKRGQALPLNTIVIAILVIIVLLVIIVFFTTKVGDAGKDIDKSNENLGACSTSNPAISVIAPDGSSVGWKDKDACNGEQDSVVPGMKNDAGDVCCITSN